MVKTRHNITITKGLMKEFMEVMKELGFYSASSRIELLMKKDIKYLKLMSRNLEDVK